MIAGLYAVTPVLNIVIANSSRIFLIIAAATAFVIASIDRTIALTAMSVHHDNAASHTFLVLWLPYTAYFLAGYILVKWPLHISVAVAMTCAVMSTVLVCLVVAYAHRSGWQDPYCAYDLFNPLGISTSIPVFACLLNRHVSWGTENARPCSVIGGPYPRNIPRTSVLVGGSKPCRAGRLLWRPDCGNSLNCCNSVLPGGGHDGSNSGYACSAACRVNG